MKKPAKSTDPKRAMRIKGKKTHNQKSGYGTIKSDSIPVQEVREAIEPEGEQARHKKAKGQ